MIDREKFAVQDTISEAVTQDDFAKFGDLIRNYVLLLRNRYAAHPWLVDMAFSHQSLAQELEDLQASYARPSGKVLLARRCGEVCGAVAYRTLDRGVCEMKRLFVLERFQGLGVGRGLCEAIIDHARSDGFLLMRLDTGTLQHEAQALYRAAGFVECPPYTDYPPEVLPFILFMMKVLRRQDE